MSFLYKDYKENNKKKILSIGVMEFIDHFMLHIVPSRFVRIRYYGIMANRKKKEHLKKCRDYYKVKTIPVKHEEQWDKILLDVAGIDIHRCSKCEEGEMFLACIISERRYRPPPKKSVS